MDVHGAFAIDAGRRFGYFHIQAYRRAVPPQRNPHGRHPRSGSTTAPDDQPQKKRSRRKTALKVLAVVASSG